MTSPQMRGLVLGMALAIVWAWLGFGAVLLTIGLGIAGWLVGTLVSSIAGGNISLGELWNDLQGRRSQS